MSVMVVVAILLICDVSLYHSYGCSVEDIGVVVLVQETGVLRLSYTEAVEEIVSVGLAELGRGLEASDVRSDIVVLLNGLNNVTLALKQEKFLGDDNI